MSIRIKQGYTGLTGRWVRHGWTMHAGIETVAFKNLQQAKLRAAELGASGKWDRHTRMDGRNRIIVYDEVPL